MGSFIGHVIPGTFFLLTGIWWLAHAVLEYAAALKDLRFLPLQRSWKQVASTCRIRHLPVEPLLKIIAAFLGICVELSGVQWRLVDEQNEFNSPTNFFHAAMYAMFAFSGVMEVMNFYKLTHFSREMEFALLAVAFGTEGMLFGFHLHGKNRLDVQLHSMLLIIIFLTVLVISLEACLPKFRRELFIARAILCLTQGTWFWEIAFTLYGQNPWIVGDTSVPKHLAEKRLTKATAIVTVIFCWHFLGWCAVAMLCCFLTSCLHRRGKLMHCCQFTSRNVKLQANGMLEETCIAGDDQESLLTEGEELLGNELTNDTLITDKEEDEELST